MKTPDLDTWILQQIKSLAAGTMLSTDAEIAKQWGISVRTVRRVMARFAADGLVTRSQGVGTYVGLRPVPQGSVASVRLSASDRVAALLLRMLSDGSIRTGQFMPSTKFLRLSLKASEHTIAAALKTLESRKLLTRVGRNFVVGSEDSMLRMPLHKEVVFIQRNDTPLEGMFYDRFLGPSFQKTERELRSMGCDLSFVQTRELPTRMKAWEKSTQVPFGLVFHRAGSQEAAAAVEIVSLAKRVDTPVPRIIADSTEAGFRSIAGACLLSRGNLRTAAARTVGEFVARKQYSSMALVIDAGTIAPLDYFWGNQKFLWDARKHATIPVRQFIGITADQDAGSIRTQIDQAGDEYYREYLAEKYGAAYDNAFWTATGFFTNPQSLPSPLENELWIVPTAPHAVAIIDQFGARGIACPQQYGVLCLDDNPMQYHHGLSVCILDWEKAGYLMAHSIIGDVPVKRSHKGYLSLGWELIERKTT